MNEADIDVDHEGFGTKKLHDRSQLTSRDLNCEAARLTFLINLHYVLLNINYQVIITSQVKLLVA